MAENDCDAELRLGFGHPSSDSNTTRYRSGVEIGSGSRAFHHQQQQQKKRITIFYNSQICVCDVTEIQARAIISMAKQEMDTGRKNHRLQDQEEERQQSVKPSPTRTPPTEPQLLNPGLSMKRSLQRFLQKRKSRINASAPYHQYIDGHDGGTCHPCSPCNTASIASFPLLCSNPSQETK